MAAPPHPRPWYRSPTLWFLLPGVVFLVWGWVFSMQRSTNLDFKIWGYSVRLRNDGAMMGAGWSETSARPFAGMAKTFHFEVIPRGASAKKDWFPLPYYTVNRMFTPLWHQLNLSYWLLLLVYLGLWQLPWLARYHRRRRIDRSLAIDPPEPTTASPD